MWKLPGKLAVEYFSGFAATKRLDYGPIINNLFTIVKRKNNVPLKLVLFRVERLKSAGAVSGRLYWLRQKELCPMSGADPNSITL
jgi:hypothetical protein